MNLENLVDDFERFWYQRPSDLKVRNESRMLKSFKRKLSSCHSTEEIDHFILESKTRKETMRKIAVEFYKYLRQKGIKVQSELDNIRFYDYPFERQLEIAKYLHEPHTNEEIMQQFSIGDERTLREDLEALRDGIEVMGTTIQIQEEKLGRKKHYRSTLHPVFLPLNLTEIYALTVYMPNILDHSNPNAEIICDIARRIKAQLSDYALKRLFPNETELLDTPVELRYINDEQLARSRRGLLMYLMKSGEHCNFFINGTKKEGRIQYDDGKYFVICKDGEKLDANLEELEFIIDSLNYH